MARVPSFRLKNRPAFVFLAAFFKRCGEPKRLWLGAGLVLLLTTLLSSNLLPDKVSLHIGDVSSEEIRAPRTVEYTDVEATNQLRAQAAQRVPNIYEEIPYAASDAIQSVSETFRRVEEVRQNGVTALPDAMAHLKKWLPFSLSDEMLAFLLKASPDTFTLLRTAAERQVGQAMSQELRDSPSDVPRARDQLNMDIRKLPLSPEERSVLSEVVGRAIRPNSQINVQRTEKLRDEERLNITPIRYPILRGEVILYKGEAVTQKHIDKLLALGLIQPAIDWARVIYLGLILTVLTVLLSLYLREYEPKVFNDYARLALLAGLVTFSVVGLKVGTGVLGLKVTSGTVGYLNMLWISTAAMLVSVLIGSQVAVAVAALLAVATGLSLDIELQFVVAAFVSSLAGIYAASRMRDRGCLIRIGVTLTVTNIALVLLLSGFVGNLSRNFLVGLAWAVSCGIGSALLFWLGIALLERPFGVTTHIGLLELCDTNRPILRRMLLEAPGTYHHSMVVSSLAEAGAEAVGIDPLLVRAMAYYHDIGKIKRPDFFIENQRMENVHDRLNPTLSMLVIAAHVRDGLEMAKELKLPPAILRGIREHHGTGLVKYFYHQAAGMQGPSAELEHQFRYDGPKPQTKDTAILMLADGVEAASRVLSKATPGQIADLIEKIFHDRLNDGQLDECDLTFRDLDLITKSFTRTLTAMLHSRIEYPQVITTTEAKKVLKYVSGAAESKAHSKPESAPAAKSDKTAAAG